ncbi:hypothetical protein E2C01_016540 [Portunus trituberculatus]|uniref:Uncharacterized protein n=1 Tax=Portunus trituberculatus TaxID=210409 RepID=A0A5B7DPN7_PORTR|nr:hypothetical protein [Portunus trituberculatus]
MGKCTNPANPQKYWNKRVFSAANYQKTQEIHTFPAPNHQKIQNFRKPQKSRYNPTVPEENEDNAKENESDDPWSLVPHVSSEAGVGVAAGVSVGAVARWAGQVVASRPCSRWLACQVVQMVHSDNTINTIKFFPSLQRRGRGVGVCQAAPRLSLAAAPVLTLEQRYVE